jgi:hypothetical protein
MEFHTEPTKFRDILLRRCAPHLLACTALLSCGANPTPVSIQVEVSPGYKGILDIAPCSSKATSKADDQGKVYTSECPRPGQEIEVVVVQGGQTYRIPPEKLSVSRAGDGVPVAISGQID